MSSKVEGVESQDDLKKAQAAAQAKGGSIANYNEWSQVLKDLSEAGVKSTGSLSGDKAKLQEVNTTIQKYIEQVQTKQAADQQKSEQQKNDDPQKKDDEQALKATVVNATSSAIMADYMKYYHLM